MLTQVYAYKVLDADGNRVVDDNGNKVTTYWTKPNGEGKQAERVVSAGGGKYYAFKWNKDDTESLLTDAERLQVNVEVFQFNMVGFQEQKHNREGQPVFNDKGEPVMTLKGGKLIKLLQTFDAIIADVKKAQNRNLGNAYTPENAANICGHVAERYNMLKSVLEQQVAGYDIAI